MPEPLPLDLPAINFDGSGPSCIAARRVYDLHADLEHGGVLPVGYEPPPDEFVIEKALFSLQSPSSIPAGFSGRVTLFVDPGGRYEREVCFKAGVEDGHPRFLKPLGYLNLAPGAVPFIEVKPSLIGPVTYRRGDLLCIVPESNGANIGAIQAFIAPIIESTWGDFKPAADVVYAVPLNGSAPGSAPPCFRSLIPNTTPGAQVSVHVPEGNVLMKASIGIQNGTGPNMTAAPLPLTWGGQPAGTGWSDPVALPQDGKPFLVNLRVAGAWRFKGVLQGYTSPAVSWYSDTDSHASAQMLGTIGSQPGPTYPARTHCVDAVRVV